MSGRPQRNSEVGVHPSKHAKRNHKGEEWLSCCCSRPSQIYWSLWL